MPDLIIVVGAGSLAIDVAEAAQMGGLEIHGFLITEDEHLSPAIRALDLPIEPLHEWLNRSIRPRGAAVIAASDCRERLRLMQCIQARDVEIARVIHPTAQVSALAELGAGSIVLAGAVIHTGGRLGKHCVVGSLASIDHDCRLDDFVDIAAGVHLAGGCSVGKLASIGLGASIGPQLTIGANSKIEAGAAVIANVPDGTEVAGIPAVDTKDVK